MAQALPTYEEWKKQKQEADDQKYRAYEDSYRAFQSGDMGAAAAFNVAFDQTDFEGWQKWRNQNRGRLDTEYAFKGLDQDVLSLVREKYKSQWGDKQYYDLFDPEDAYRQQAGEMPKYLLKKYDLNDPVDQYLLANNLPYKDMFNNMYSEAYLDYQTEQADRQNRLNGIASDWNAYIDEYDAFQKDYIAAANKARQAKGAELTDEELEQITGQLLMSGKYDSMARRYNAPKDDSDKSALELYLDYLDTSDYSAYDAMLTALQEGKDVDDSFFDVYKDSDYKKWLGQKTEITQQDLTDAYRRSVSEAEVKLYTDYAEAAASGDTADATEKLGRIKTKVEDELQAGKWEKANALYTVLMAKPIMGSSPVDLKEATFDDIEDSLRKEMRRKQYSDKEIEEYIGLRRQEEAVAQDEQNLQQQEELAKSKKTADEMAEAAEAAMSAPGYVPKTVEGDAEFRGESWQEWVDELVDENASGLKRLWQSLIQRQAGRDMGKYEARYGERDFVLDTPQNPKYYVQRYMTEDERAVLNYYRTEKGDDKAREYLEALMPTLYARDAETAGQMATDIAGQSPLVASLLPTVTQLQTAAEGFQVGIEKILSGENPVVNDPRMRTSRMNAEMRSSVMADMSPAGQFFYETGMSILDNLARLPMGKAGLGMMAGSVMSQRTDQALQNGATPEQALALGTAAALIEVVTEKVPLERILNPKMAGSAKQIVMEALKQAGVEASEEMASEVLNTMADIQIMQGDSEWEQAIAAYMADDPTMTRQQAEAKVFGDKTLDVLLSGAGGFLSGGIMGGGGTMLYNYRAGLKSGGNALNALSVGTKAIEQYKQDVANAQKAGDGLQAQVIQDIGTLPVDVQTKQSMIEVSGRLSQQPTTWLPDSAVGAYRNFSRALNNLANHARSVNAEYTAKQQKTAARLTSLYDAVQAAYDESRAALDSGDLRAHSAAVQKVQKAIESYKAAFFAAETESAVLETKKAEQDATIANKAKAETEKLNGALEEATQYQKEKARTLTRLEDLAELRNDLAVSEMSLEEMDADLEENNNYAIEKAAEAMARGDVDAYNMWEDAVAYKDNQKDTDGPLKNTGKGDTFDVINEMVNGGQNEAVQAKGETNAETGRDRVSRAESDLAQDAGRSEEQNAGREGRDGAQDSGANRTAWRAQQERDIKNAVAEYNRTHEKQMPVGSIRKAGKISEAVQKVADYIKGITGRDSFFVESDTDLIGGFQTNDRRYVVYTGDPMTDLFNLAHENGHSNKDFLDIIYAALDSGKIPNRSFQAYVRQRTENIARKQGIPASRVNENRSKLREEFACDMFGLYMTEQYFGTANWNQYGIPTNSRQVVRNAFNAVLQDAKGTVQEQTDSRRINRVERSADDELYDSLLRSGAAISESDAKTVEKQYRSLASKGAAIAENDAQLGNLNEDFAESPGVSVPFNVVQPSLLAELEKAGVAIDYEGSPMYKANQKRAAEKTGGFQFSENSEVKSYERQESAIQANRNTVANMESVCDLTGNEFSRNGEPVIDRVDAFFAKHGNSVYNEELGDIDMVHSSIHDDLSHGKGYDKITAFAAIPDVLKHGHVVEYSSNWKDRGYDTALVAAPITIGGEPYFAGCRVMRKVNDNSQRYYIHEVIFYGEKEPSETFTTRFSAKGGATRASDSSSIKIVLSEIAGIKRDAESSQFEFSENAPTKRQSRLNEAWELYDERYNPTEYYAENRDTFDLKTSNLLRGLMLRNGENVGGALSDANMERITDIFSRANRRHAIGLTISSPVRVFEDVTGWGGSTAEERAQNVRDGNYLKNTYYEYGNVQAANRETWIAEKMQPVMEAITQNGGYGVFESAVTQMLGEGIITKDQAENAVCDGKTMIIEAVDGVFVLDGKGRMLYSSDSRTATHYIDMPIAKRAENAIRKKSKGELAKHVVKRELPPLKVVRDGNTVTVKKDNGEVVAQVAGGTKPNMQAVNAAVNALKTFYEEAYNEISNVRLENGYAPPGYIENYFPHQSRTYDGVEGFIEALTANDLPTGINGLTGTFSPGQPWNANLQTRLGTYTEFDAIRGFNRYVNGAGDTIFYTPVIQRLRQLEKAIRTQGANALTEEDAKRNSAFVDWLHEYANEWANKKSSFDRGAESIFGREAYSVSQMLTKMVSASAVGGNVSSAMSNIISGLTGYAQIDAKYTVPEIVRTVGQLFQLLDKKGQYDGFADKIPFLKRRFSDNEDILLQNVDKLKRKGSKALYAMFSAVDRFTVESVARAKYAECMANGMTDVQAIAATNDMLIKNFADRGKGQAARVFNVKWLRPVAQFQLEVLNQMNHFRDMDREEVEAKLADLEKEYAGGIPFNELEAKALSSGGYRKLKKELAYLVLLSLWGMVTRALMGRDQTWNPYGMAKDAVEDLQEGGVKQAGEGIMEAVIDNAPFLSVLSGGGRVPLAGNLSYVTNILESMLNGESEKLTNADWIKGGTAFIPGGGQLRKTLTGIDANAQGGSYTNDGKLRYPISEDDFWKSVVFGPSAVTPDDYEWGTALSTKDTAVYQELVEEGYDQADLYDTLFNYGGASNAEKALSLLANRNDFSDDELDVIAEAVGLNYKGSLEQYAEKEANKYLTKKQKELEAGDISQESYDEIESVFDEYFRLLGMDN